MVVIQLTKNYFIYFTLFGALYSCSADRVESISKDHLSLLKEFRNLDSSSQLKIVSDDEPGTRLYLCLTFVEKEGKRPIPHNKIKLYHTSNSGSYEPTNPKDESTARLNGTTLTDNLGRIYIETILPGDYGSSANNRHIHTTVFGAKPEGYDIHFKQYSTAMFRRFATSSDQHFIADLKKDELGNLLAFVTLEVKF